MGKPSNKWDKNSSRVITSVLDSVGTLIALGLFSVRDAAARLPNGEGTRAEICELLKDSQFLAPDVTSAQVSRTCSNRLTGVPESP